MKKKTRHTLLLVSIPVGHEFIDYFCATQMYLSRTQIHKLCATSPQTVYELSTNCENSDCGSTDQCIYVMDQSLKVYPKMLQSGDLSRIPPHADVGFSWILY